MQAAHRAVPVIRAVHVVAGKDLTESGHELGQVPRIDRRVLHEGQRLGIAVDAEEQSEPGLAELPDRLLLGGVEGEMGRVAEAFALAARFQGLHLGPHLGLVITGVLHDEDGRGITLHEAHPLRLLDVAPGEVEDELVGQLDGVGPGLEDRLGGLERLLDVAIVDDVEGRPLRTIDQAHLRLEDRDERALRAGDEPGHAERPRADS